MHEKAIWKPWGLNPQLQLPAYNHKTQFFMKNEGQQKYLDKALQYYLG